MFVELIESLRCPREHPESPLVASATKTDARHIIEGVLGCPVCNAEYPIREGVAQFDNPPNLTTFEIPSEETAMRLGAFLELTNPQGFALLCSRWSIHIEPLNRLTDTPVVAVNPSIATPIRLLAGAIRGAVIPFAEGSARAFAIDNVAAPGIVESGVRAVRSGGRILGPATIPVPDGVTEIVRDEVMWVGEKTAASGSTPRLVSLARSKRQN